MLNINKSSVSRDVVKRVEAKGMESFKQSKGRNPNAQEKAHIEKMVRDEARKLNR